MTTPSETAPLQGDKYLLEVFDINIAQCMFCGPCVEACPYDALFMGSGFEQGQYSRKEMVIGLDQLRQAEKYPSTFFRPQLESAGYKAHDGQPLDWKEVGRESWRWHQQEKAGMRLSSASSSESEDPSPATPDESDSRSDSSGNSSIEAEGEGDAQGPDAASSEKSQ